jgi:putative endonuclease
MSIEAIWWVYLLRCRDGRTYAGIALDVEQRFLIHCQGRGARFTRSNRPVAILGRQAFAGKGAALRAEYILKQLPRAEKLAWARKHGGAPAPRAYKAFKKSPINGRKRSMSTKKES